MLLPILFLLTVLVSLYDFRTRRIPNWVTLPLWTAGLLVHFPGGRETWLASALLMVAFASKWMGAGDVKLWLTLVWALPPALAEKILPLLFGVFFVSGLMQLGWRRWRCVPLIGIRTPAAWRTIPFVLVLWLAN